MSGIRSSKVERAVAHAAALLSVTDETGKP